jgi:hypothetical protein
MHGKLTLYYLRSREIFNKWEAQRWWGENYDRIVELYNVMTFSGRQQGASTPLSSVDDSVMVSTQYSLSMNFLVYLNYTVHRRI